MTIRHNFSEEPVPTTDVMPPLREQFDLMLMKKLRAMKAMPMLGVCGGLQLMNVALGGSLIQDIESESLETVVKHRGQPGWKVADWHEVSITEGTRLFEIYGTGRVNVPTAHRQAIRRLAEGLCSSAVTDDSVIEGAELPDHTFAVGVQWHPERDLEGNARLFGEFVRHATAYSKHHKP